MLCCAAGRLAIHGAFPLVHGNPVVGDHSSHGKQTAASHLLLLWAAESADQFCGSHSASVAGDQPSHLHTAFAPEADLYFRQLQDDSCCQTGHGVV